MTSLKPCPFYGGAAEIVHARNYYAWCDKCETRGDWYSTEAEAIKAWNTRAERTCHKKKHLNLTIGDNFLTQSGWDCSECGGRLDLPVWTFYCPTCGAKVVDE